MGGTPYFDVAIVGVQLLKWHADGALIAAFCMRTRFPY
jgi:hypothetical protein